MKLNETELKEMYEHCKKLGVNDPHYKEYVDKVLASKDPKWNYLFARDVPGADVQAHGQAVRASKSPVWNFQFVLELLEISNIDIKAYEEILIEEPCLKYMFLKYIEDARIKTHELIANKTASKKAEIINIERIKNPYPKTGKLREIVRARNEIKKIEMQINQSYYIMKFKNMELKELFEYCKKFGVKDPHYAKCAYRIIASKDPYWNYMFARYIKGADVTAHEEIVIAKKDNPKLNYLFAKFVTGADVKAHGQAIIASKNPELNYEFARDIKGADIQAHEQVVNKYGDPYLKYMFKRLIENKVVKVQKLTLKKPHLVLIKGTLEEKTDTGLNPETDDLDIVFEDIKEQSR